MRSSRGFPNVVLHGLPVFFQFLLDDGCGADEFRGTFFQIGNRGPESGLVKAEDPGFKELFGPDFLIEGISDGMECVVPSEKEVRQIDTFFEIRFGEIEEIAGTELDFGSGRGKLVGRGFAGAFQKQNGHRVLSSVTAPGLLWRTV